MVAEKVTEPCRKEVTTQLDLVSGVKKLNVLSYKDLGKLIRDAKNGIIKYTINGSSFETNVEKLGRPLVQHIMKDTVSSLKPDEQHFKYLLSGLKLLHTLCDIASHHSTLARVFIEDMNVQHEMLNSIFRMIHVLSQFGEKINGLSQMVLYSALLSNSMYLLKALISSEWKDIADVLLAHPEVGDFALAALTAVRININLLQAKPTTQRINSRMQSNDEVYCLFHLCESSIQFIQSLCKNMLFRERLAENKELCRGGAVFSLVQNTLKLSQHDDSLLASVVDRLKSKVISITLLLCQAESSSFVDMASRTPQSKGFAQSAVLKVIEVVNMMCNGDLESQTRGLLLFTAMKLTEIFSGASGFKTFIIHNLTEVLTQVLSQPQREFLSSWCSDDRTPAEEEIVVDFNPTLAAGHVLGLTSEFKVQHSTWSNCQAPQTPFAIQRSSLLVKVIANLARYEPDLSEEDNARFINEFLKCLQTESSKLPGGAAERTDAARKNLSSLLAHAESLIPIYLHETDVNVLRWYVSQLEKRSTAQESSSHRVMEVHNNIQCPSPTPQSPSSKEHDTTGNHEEGPSVRLPIKKRRIDLGEISGDRNIEPFNSVIDVEELRNEDTQQKNRRKKSDNGLVEYRMQGRKFTFMSDHLIESKLNNRHEAAMDGHLHSDGDDAVTENQTGSNPTFEPKVGQYVMFTNAEGEEIGRGKIHKTSGVWFEKDLAELKLCVLDVTDLEVWDRSELPHPTDTMFTFLQAKVILGKTRILWDSSRLILISEEMPR